MSVALVEPVERAQAPPTPAWMALARLLGWVLIVAGAVVGLFIVYLLFWTGLETETSQRAQFDQWRSQAESWGLDNAAVDALDGGIRGLPLSGPLGPEPEDDGAPDEAGAPVVVAPEPGSAYALLWFERDGERIVNDQALSVVEGVSLSDLRAGPGHYPGSAGPGRPGNFSIAGHRTTWGAPLYNLDALQSGDEIHVIDLEGRHFVYVVEAVEVVSPADTWVLNDDPLGRGGDHWMVLTTCHPRFSATQRLVAFGSLQSAT